jgi:hypothetical protein
MPAPKLGHRKSPSPPKISLKSTLLSTQRQSLLLLGPNCSVSSKMANQKFHSLLVFHRRPPEFSTPSTLFCCCSDSSILVLPTRLRSWVNGGRLQVGGVLREGLCECLQPSPMTATCLSTSCSRSCLAARVQGAVPVGFPCRATCVRS